MTISQKFWRSLLFFVILAALCGSFVFPVAYVPVNAAPNFVYPGTSVVISEFRFHGSAGGNDEFIELYNPTGASIDISGWLIRGSNNAGTTGTRATIPAATNLAPGQYYLIANNGYSGVVIPDLTYATGITDDGGVALTLADAVTVVDQAGLSVGSTYKEGTTLAPLTTNVDRGYERRIGGANGNCQDDGNNAADFTLTAPSNPQNSGSATVACGVPTVTSSPTPPQVIISEVAWAGTAAFAGDEWIELYNNGGTDIDMTGWRIEAADGDPSINLSGTITAGSFFLLERGDDNVVSDVSASQVYSSGLLSDSGEVLYLLNVSRAVVDTANSSGGSWDAGQASSFSSMERIINGGVVATDNASGWITNSQPSTWTTHDAASNLIHGTPGYANWAFTVTPTATSTATSTPTATGTPTNTGTPTPTGTRTRTPTPLGFLSLVINEVAWSGTAASTSDEWIELYNPGASSINLSGWVLKAADGTPNIALSGIISGGGYFLLERTDDNTVIDATADQIYTGELENTAEILQLFDPTNRLIDTANSNGGAWPAGNSTTFNSMERRAVVTDSDTAWITNTKTSTWTKHDARGISSANYLIRGTPGYSNWAYTVTPTASPKPTVTPTRTPSRAPTVAPAQLVAINEFVPRPGHDWNNDGEVNVEDEYIEIINHGVVNVNLSGYSLDDEANIGSNPYRLPATIIKPGERIVFYGSETGLLLSDGGDGVRLLKPNGQLMDAYNYTVARYPDQSFCRLPDDGGLDDWNQNCYPTPGLQNSLNSVFTPPSNNVGGAQLCPIADTLPDDFVFAECSPYGNNIWRRAFWDETGWYDEKVLPGIDSRWDIFAD